MTFRFFFSITLSAFFPTILLSPLLYSTNYSFFYSYYILHSPLFISSLDYKGAIEFLLVANKTEEAFKLAQTHSLVDVYCSIIGDQIGNEEALKVAQYYEKNDFGKAGR
jgi:hypothetical protein